MEGEGRDEDYTISLKTFQQPLLLSFFIKKVINLKNTYIIGNNGLSTGSCLRKPIIIVGPIVKTYPTDYPTSLSLLAGGGYEMRPVHLL